MVNSVENGAAAGGSTGENVRNRPNPGIGRAWPNRGGPHGSSGRGRRHDTLESLTRRLTRAALTWALLQTAAVLAVLRLVSVHPAVHEAWFIGGGYAWSLILPGVAILLSGAATALVLVKMVMRLVARRLQALTRSAREQSQERLVRKSTLDALNRFTAGVAHQINNPAAYVTGNLETLREYTSALEQRIDELDNAPAHTPEIDQIRRDLPELIAASIGGMERIKRVMRALSSATDPEPTVFSNEELHDCVREAVETVRDTIKYEHSLLLDLQQNISARVVRSRLVVALSNILLNARDALGPNGVIRVSLRSTDRNAQITISDNGRGIPPDDLPLVFEPFFTSKQQAAGAGLGLFVSQRLVDEAGGAIQIESVPSQGTTVTVSLPLIQAVGASLS